MRRALVSMVVVAGLVLLSRPAAAQDLKDRFNIRIGATGMYLGETQGAKDNKLNESPLRLQLFYGELRGVMDARRLPGSFELHVDARVRFTGPGFSQDSAVAGTNQTSARGYLGSSEYEVRQVWVRRRGAKVDFAFGRQVVPEADSLRFDGLRLWIRPARHWELSLQAGAYPDPYSRSLTSDYVLGGPTFVGGAATAYTYDRIWGSFSATAAYLGGLNDGGRFDPANPLGMPKTEGIRAWATWTNYVRFASWFDLYHDLVFDLAGSAGFQVTRADVLAAVHGGKHFTLRVGFDHLSALAIEMYLTRLLARDAYASTVLPAKTIENNLTVQRTARNEGRLQLDVTYGKFSVFGEGRFRQRAIVDLADDPQFNVLGRQVAPGLAFDGTLGLRDRGTLWKLRPGLWASYIADYRAQNVIVGVDLGRNFLTDRLNVDLLFLYALTKDLQHDQQTTGKMPCVAAPPTQFITLPQALYNCFGSRNGNEYELGLTLTSEPVRHWFAMFDYRLAIDLTDGVQALYTNVVLVRVEARY